jgi:7,8-dihydropterin-6-yl-methyl-4-(beta-D-ribofuranosyl)aminobenzene 5'-phosphate synthase
MGGWDAQKAGRVSVPDALDLRRGLPCHLPDRASAPGLDARIVDGPAVLEAGIGTTGPLARALFMTGYIEEQALLARVAGGIVVITGCGHPTVEVILEMVRRLTDEPVHAIVGGLHFPVRASRVRSRGIEMQMLFGTGKPPWRPIDDADLDRAIGQINASGARRALLSAHDTDDHAIARLERELDAQVEVLRAGATYSL